MRCFLASIFLYIVSWASPAYAIGPFIGINTNEPVHFDASIPFVDLFRVAEPFANNKTFTKGNVQYDANGWVKNLNGGTAGAYFIRWINPQALPPGALTVQYLGKGQIGYPVGVKVLKQSPGRDIIQLVPDKNGEFSAAIQITDSDPSDPIRNIKITLPGGVCAGQPGKHANNADACGGQQYYPFAERSEDVIFNPDYIAFMQQFRTLRFMNMSGITRNPLAHWRDRPHMQEATWGGNEGQRGVPIEIMVELANRLNANAWFNLPHAATNDFIYQHARYVADSLRPHLKAYVEYTNEAWNTVFLQTKYARDQGIRRQLDTDPEKAGLKFYALRSTQVFKIWSDVFNNPNRLVRVLSGWAANPGNTPILLNTANAKDVTDAFAIAPYFHMAQAELMRAKTPGDIFAQLYGRQHYSIPRVVDRLNDQLAHLKPLGIPMIAYEGGQHLVHYKTRSLHQHPNPVLAKANRDPRMEKAYVDFLNGFRQAGGQLFMAFSAPRQFAFWGFWGVKEHIRQPAAQAPKYRALLKF